MEPAILAGGGAQPAKPPRVNAVWIGRWISGYVSQRNPMVQAGTRADYRFYGGRPDTLIDGANCEVTNSNTLRRRPGSSAYSSVTFSNPITSGYSWLKQTGPQSNVVVLLLASSSEVDVVTTSTKMNIFTKSAGAGQTFFLGIGKYLYFADGVSPVSKFDGTNTWNMGIAPPAAAPTVTVVQAGVAAALWQANTFFSTMGILVDSNGNAQALQAILGGTGATGSNAGGPNASQFGLSSNGQPVWNQLSGGNTVETGGTPITWFNVGPIGVWGPSATISWSGAGGSTSQPAAIYDPTSNAVYAQINSNTLSGITGNNKPQFNGIFGTIYFDGTVKWVCLGLPPQWTPGASHGNFKPNIQANCAIIEGGSLPAGTTTVYLQVNNGSAGTSGSTYSNPNWTTTAGLVTIDNQIVWICLGSAAWAALSNMVAWTNPTAFPFSCIKDSNNNFQVCIVGGQTGASPPTWQTAYGAQTVDGTVTWVCVGGATTNWTANKAYYLPKVGFNPPQPTDPYGGADILDVRVPVDAEFVISSGFSGGSAPAWNAPGSTTTDSGVTWFNNGPPVTASLTWTAGFGYCTAFEARRPDDTFNTTVPPGQTLPLGAPTGSQDGSMSTASPTVSFQSSNAGGVVTLTGLGSPDPQVDTIPIFRTTDGGGIFKLLTKIPNPKPIGGIAQTWTFTDTVLDSALLPILQTAPLAHVNDPPPAAALGFAFHSNRIWAFAGNTLYYSSGPDAAIGNGFTAWPPANIFTLPGPIFHLEAAQPGLLVFTGAGVFVVRGSISASGALAGASGTVYFVDPFLPSLAVLNFNAVTSDTGQIWAFTSTHQVVQIDASGPNEPGFPIGDQLINVDPTLAALTFHRKDSTDTALYLSQNDGSNKIWRMNPNLAPEGGPCWSPAGVYSALGTVGGMVLSLATSLGGKDLLIAANTSGNQKVYKRDPSTAQDGGISFTWFATVGSLVLAQPGQMAATEFITVESKAAGSIPTVGVLLDEIAAINGATFEQLSGIVSPEIPDPPDLSSSVSLFSTRFYLDAAGFASLARHIQIKISYPAENFIEEVLTLTPGSSLEAEG